MTTQQDDIKALREALKEYVEWEAAGFPIGDLTDTYPNDILNALTTPDRIARLLDELEAARAKAMPDDDGIEWPDVDDMAHSAVQEAYAFGVSHDVFKRHMLSVMFKTAGAIRAAIASKEST